jgi:hypothetical protein
MKTLIFTLIALLTLAACGKRASPAETETAKIKAMLGIMPNGGDPMALPWESLTPAKQKLFTKLVLMGAVCFPDGIKTYLHNAANNSMRNRSTARVVGTTPWWKSSTASTAVPGQYETLLGVVAKNDFGVEKEVLVVVKWKLDHRCNFEVLGANATQL